MERKVGLSKEIAAGELNSGGGSLQWGGEALRYISDL